MGKQSSPPAPNYQPIAESSLAAAAMQQQTSKDQLDWAKAQYADQAPVTKAYMNSMIDTSGTEKANAQTDRTRYEGIYQPVENSFVNKANDYNSPERAQQQEGAAIADVASTTANARAASLSNLESYGIDPSQTRYAALDLGSRIQGAASEAAAGTQSRLNTEATGMALQGEAINIGKGYPGQVAQSYAGAVGDGQAGIASQLNTMQTGSNLMGSPTSWASAANMSSGMGVNALNTGFSNQMDRSKFQAQQSQQFASNVSSLAGAAIGAVGMGVAV